MIDRYLFRQITVAVTVVGVLVIAALLLTGCSGDPPPPRHLGRRPVAA